MSEVERQLLRVLAENKQLREVQRTMPVAGSGGGPHDPGMEIRLAAVEAHMGGLEGRMERLEGRMDALDIRLRAVEQGIATLNGKIDVLVSQVVGKLPNWWQMPAVIGSTVALLVALYAAVQYLHTLGLL